MSKIVLKNLVSGDRLRPDVVKHSLGPAPQGNSLFFVRPAWGSIDNSQAPVQMITHGSSYFHHPGLLIQISLASIWTFLRVETRHVPSASTSTTRWTGNMCPSGRKMKGYVITDGKDEVWVEGNFYLNYFFEKI